MPPRSASSASSKGGRAHASASSSASPASGPSHGRGAGRGAVRAGVSSPVGLASPSTPITTVGVKRPKCGRAGTEVAIVTNSYVLTHPDRLIRHYDEFSFDFSPRIRRIILKKLEDEIAPEVFTDKFVFDGKKNLFTSYKLDLGESDSRRFDITLSPSGATGDRPPKVHTVTLTKVNEINPEVLSEFVGGRLPMNENVLTAIMALNVVLRMDPSENHPFRGRSFFTDGESKDIGSGIVLWRGYFQSVRPGIGRMFVNVDISTATMYKHGPLLDLCWEFFGRPRTLIEILSPARDAQGPANHHSRERRRLKDFLLGLKIIVQYTIGSRPNNPRVITNLTTAGADALVFDFDASVISVANYFKTQRNRSLEYPGAICVEVGRGTALPLEMCFVPPGQIMKKQIPSGKIDDMVKFSTMRPADRFKSIENGAQSVLNYGQSEYIRKFGMAVDTTAGFLQITARVLDAPTLKYGDKGRQRTIKPKNGSWNMQATPFRLRFKYTYIFPRIDKVLYAPKAIHGWVIVSYANQQRLPVIAQDIQKELLKACQKAGIPVGDKAKDPLVTWKIPAGDIATQLKEVLDEAQGSTGQRPNLMVVVLPNWGNSDIYTAVKHFGDILEGIATQCLKEGKCSHAKEQYWANICLKINPKLGGVNAILDPDSVRVLNDPVNPTIVMGADAIHPAPGSKGRPSFTAVVGNVDSNNARYIATTRVQTSNQELIDDLQEMCKHILEKYVDHQARVELKPAFKAPPKRLIFFRDGVSEGQFEQVLKTELPMIKAACAELKMNPEITLIIVGKRHHVRFKTQNENDEDKSGNCRAGTVVDQEIGHPTEFDFFLQSHGGLLGTSRPAHYSVLYDENGFNADSIQALSFALCHVYARATRSVSIPAPVYYADIVCSRAKHHYDPNSSLSLSDTATEATEATEATDTLERFKQSFMPLHENTSGVMYFS